MSALNWYKNLPLSRRIYISTALGFCLGMFFGHRCSNLEHINTMFIRLFQIAIIPYMTFSIVHSIGSLTTERAKRVGKKGGLILIFMWSVSILFAFGLQFSFPNIERSKFFRPEGQLERTGIDFFDLFIPSNPFHSFANGYIPAIVIFCILIGIALMNHKNKNGIVRSAKIWSSIMNKVNEYVMQLLPYGVLVMSTYTFGTLSFMKLKGILLYVIASVFYLIFISIIIYPIILSSVSKFNFKKFFHYAMPPALIAFSTASVFLSLPVIYNQMYKFNEEEGGFSGMTDSKDDYIERGRNAISILVPLAWVVPASYKFLVIFYVVFAHWYYDRAFEFADQLMYFIFGIPCLFGSNSVVVPFLLQLSGGLPNQAYNIFMIVSSFLVYFTNANGSIFIVVCTILCYLSLSNHIQIKWFKLIWLFVASAVFFILVMGFLSLLMTKILSGDDEVKNELRHMNVQPYNKHYYQEIEVSYLDLKDYRKIDYLNPEEELLQKITRTKTLQVGYDPEAIPFSFFNEDNKLVGYDIDFIYDIAENLRCSKIEFYPVYNYEEYNDCLNKGIMIDICVGGYVYTGSISDNIINSSPYMKYTPAIVVPMRLKAQYQDFESVFQSPDVTIGIRISSDYRGLMLRRSLVGLRSFKDFYVNHATDTLITSAEIASAISIIYHGYWVYYYLDQDIKLFYAFLLQYAKRAETFRDVINTWIETCRWDGSAEKRFKYWILGESIGVASEPWSVLNWLNKNKFFIGSIKN